MKKNVVLIMMITILVKAFGFLREVVLSYYYGASIISDAYLVAQTIPTTLFALIGTGLGTTFIPIYTKVLRERSEKEAQDFSGKVITVVTLISLVLVLGVLWRTPFVVKLFASGLVGEALEIAVYFSKISIFGILFSGVIYIITAFLQMKNSFAAITFLSMPMNLVMIMSFYFAHHFGIKWLAYGLLGSIVVQFLYLLPFAHRKGFSWRMKLDLKDPNLKMLVWLAAPIILGTSVNQLNILVDKNIASNVALGGISALNYASRLNIFIQGLFVTPMITVLYPNISNKVLVKDHEGLKAIFNESMVYMSILILPATIGAMVLSKPIIEMLFLRGQFDERALIMTQSALFYYAVGMLFFAFREILSRIFYAYKDTKTPTVNAIVGVLLNIVLNIILSKSLGIGGLALATSLSAMVTTLLLFFSLRKKLPGILKKRTLVNIGKILANSLCMGLFAYVLYAFFNKGEGGTLALLITIGLSGVLYALGILLSKIPEVKRLKDSISKKMAKFF